MRGAEDLGCLALAPGPTGHVHRCIATRMLHVGLHWCACGESFREWFFGRPADGDQEVIEAMEAAWAAGDGDGMTSPLDGLVTITFVADANTPAQYASSAGRVLAISAAVQVGTSGHLVGIPGVLRQGAGGLEFLMTAEGAGPADPSPPWAQQLATTLGAINTKLDTIIGGAAREADLQTAIGKLDQIIGGAARQNTLNAIGADVTAIKTKTGA